MMNFSTPVASKSSANPSASTTNSSGVIVMHASIPSALTAEIASNRSLFAGQNGSKVLRISSSSVVTVIFTCTRPPFSTISRNKSQSRTMSGLRV